MKKIVVVFLSTMLFLNIVKAQDIIYKTDGDEIKAKVLEVSEVIKYKKADNADGPTYSIAKQDVFMIKYANGTKEMFSAVQDRKSTRLNSSHLKLSRMPSSA